MLFNCSTNESHSKQEFMKIEDALKEVNHWIEIEGVEAVGQGSADGNDCIIIVLSNPQKELKQDIPNEYKGFKIVFVESDKIIGQ